MVVRSSVESVTSAAPTFSARRSARRVPGIGTTFFALGKQPGERQLRNCDPFLRGQTRQLPYGFEIFSKLPGCHRGSVCRMSLFS